MLNDRLRLALEAAGILKLAAPGGATPEDEAAQHRKGHDLAYRGLDRRQRRYGPIDDAADGRVAVAQRGDLDRPSRRRRGEGVTQGGVGVDEGGARQM